MNLPENIANALVESQCPDRHKVADLYFRLSEIGTALQTEAIGSKRRIDYSNACVRISSRLLSREPWGETDIASIEAEIAAFAPPDETPAAVVETAADAPEPEAPAMDPPAIEAPAETIGVQTMPQPIVGAPMSDVKTV